MALYPGLVVLTFSLYHVTLCGGRYVDSHDDRFMSDINLERFYIMEESALSKADVLLRGGNLGEDDDEYENDTERLAHIAPNLTEFKSLINATKDVHRLAGLNLPAFLAHPINVYHLLHRLATGWKAGLNILLKAEAYKRWQVRGMASRLKYLCENLPGSKETNHVISYLAQLQRIYGLPANDLARGKVKDMTSLKPLTLDEQMDIAKGLHESEDMSLSLKWLQLINDSLAGLSHAHRERLKFRETELYHMQAAAHFHMKNYDQALKITQRILELDPLCPVAQGNYKFFKRKVEERRLPSDGPDKQPGETSKYQRLCSRRRQRKVPKKTCRLHRVGLSFYNVEYVRSTPEVVVFHDVISGKTAQILRGYAHNKQWDQAWTAQEKFHTPAINVELTKLTRAHATREVRRVQRQVTTLAKIMSKRPVKWPSLQVINVGLEGMHLYRHTKRFQLLPHETKYRGNPVGAFLIFLNNATAGGQAVLERHGVSVTPERGTVLFYHPSETKANSFCPVIGTSLWVAIQPMYENLKDFCAEEDEWR